MILAPLDPMWWADRALCRVGDPDAMFPEGGTAKRRPAERQAARACAAVGSVEVTTSPPVLPGRR